MSKYITRRVKYRGRRGYNSLRTLCPQRDYVFVAEYLQMPNERDDEECDARDDAMKNCCWLPNNSTTAYLTEFTAL